MIFSEIDVPQFLQNGVLWGTIGSVQFPKWELYLEYTRCIWEYPDESHF
jgi:hypothetical protein